MENLPMGRITTLPETRNKGSITTLPEAKKTGRIITLPKIRNMAEVAGLPCYPSDFAVATGASTDRYYFTTPALLRTAGGRHTVQTSGLFGKDKTVRDAGARGVGVAPNFPNPEAYGIGLTTIKNHTVLTLNDKVLLYPQSIVDKEFGETLSALFIVDGDGEPVGNFHSDAVPLRNNFWLQNKNRPYVLQNNPCYAYQGAYYVYLETMKIYDEDSTFTSNFTAADYYTGGNWFRCEPIRAGQCADGSIQVVRALFATQFEPQKSFEAHNCSHGQELNTDKFAIGHFMHQAFWQDLVRNTALHHTPEKLSKLNPAVLAAVGRKIKTAEGFLNAPHF